MHKHSFDILKWIKKAQTVGFTPKQAKFQAKTLARFIDCIATKQDLAIALQASEARSMTKMTVRFSSMLSGTIVLIPIVMKLMNFIN